MVGALKFFKPMKIGAMSLFSFIFRHWYFFVLFLVLFPVILGSIGQAIDEKNPIIPLVDLGLVLANADAQIGMDVQTLKDNPAELIGSVKPTNGMWKTVVYYWGVTKVIFRELGLIWAIFFPFIIIFKVLRHRNQSESGKNVTLTIIYGLIFVLVINLILIVRGLVSGELIPALPEGLSFNQQALIVVYQALPFHGLVSLVKFLVDVNVSSIFISLF